MYTKAYGGISLPSAGLTFRPFVTEHCGLKNKRPEIAHKSYKLQCEMVSAMETFTSAPMEEKEEEARSRRVSRTRQTVALSCHVRMIHCIL